MARWPSCSSSSRVPRARHLRRRRRRRQPHATWSTAAAPLPGYNAPARTCCAGATTGAGTCTVRQPVVVPRQRPHRATSATRADPGELSARRPEDRGRDGPRKLVEAVVAGHQRRLRRLRVDTVKHTKWRCGRLCRPSKLGGRPGKANFFQFGEAFDASIRRSAPPPAPSAAGPTSSTRCSITRCSTRRPGSSPSPGADAIPPRYTSGLPSYDATTRSSSSRFSTTTTTRASFLRCRRPGRQPAPPHSAGR